MEKGVLLWQEEVVAWGAAEAVPAWAEDGLVVSDKVSAVVEDEVAVVAVLIREAIDLDLATQDREGALVLAPSYLASS